MKKISLLIPVYNDWESLFLLIKNIDLVIDSHWNIDFSILVVNDSSSLKRPEYDLNVKNIKDIKMINMTKNKGHARCNAAGLKYLSENENFDYVIIMDGDGEDRPEEISLFIKKLKIFPDKVITANRVKRSEGFIFKFFYFVHKFLTFVFTGQTIKFGNYTCLPKSIVNEMVNESATWSSFSGSLAKISNDRRSISSERGKRYFGPSKMSFVSLLKHSLSIIAVFKTTLIIRSIIFLIAYLFLVMGKISVITLIPFIAIIIMMFSVIILSKRENMSEYNSSLDNIKKIDIIK